MKSEFLLGVLGFLIVVSTLAGGMIVAGLCHDLLTRNIKIFYMVWLWIGLIPFWWITGRIMAERIAHPAATYLLLLPFLLLCGVLFSVFGVNNRWIVLILGTAHFACFSIAERLFGKLHDPRTPNDQST